jgi:hypothetical protein
MMRGGTSCEKSPSEICTIFDLVWAVGGIREKKIDNLVSITFPIFLNKDARRIPDCIATTVTSRCPTSSRVEKPASEKPQAKSINVISETDFRDSRLEQVPSITG